MKSRNTALLLVLALGVFLGSYFLKQGLQSSKNATSEEISEERIITMAPSSGEVIFALGLEGQLVGVSRFMRYPESAKYIPKIGGYLDVDLEALVRLKPTSVVLLEEQGELAKQLTQLGIQCVDVNHMSLEGIEASITKLGKVFGRENEARQLVEQLEKSTGEAKNSGTGKSELSVLISFGRDSEGGGLLTAAGAEGYHQELLKVIGVKNAYSGAESFPQLNREHLIRMNPDVIIDLYNTADFRSIGEETIQKGWSEMNSLKAVQTNNVHVLGGDVHFIPGPRFVETLEAIATIVEEYDER
jgi:iron complex transport system substrate-binding protein